VKLLALLKDSLREAVDRKIFAAMLVLSGLLTLFVFSISYRTITLEDDLQTAVGTMTWGMSFNPHLGKPTFRIENFRQTNDAKEPWLGDYQFDWVAEATDLGKIPPGLPTTRWGVRRFMNGIHYLKNVEVSENESKEKNQPRFTVTTHGTTVDDALGWRYEPKILFAVPLPFFHTSVREMVYFVESSLVSGLGAWVAVLVGVVITASFIPNMLQTGAIELWLSKPIYRPARLAYKYLGGLVFVFLLTAATVFGVWAAIGLRSGIWATGFLIVIPAVTFYFALLYSVSTLTAVFTRSTVVAILATLAVWFGLWLNGVIHSTLDGFRQVRIKAEQTVRDASGAPDAPDKPDDEAGGQQRPQPPDLPQWVYTTSDVFYKVLPRTGEMNDLTAAWVGRGLLSEADQKRQEKTDRPPWWETVGVTAAFIGVMLGLACWKFTRTDY
jgi:ABC-type transport system involved in multi-copper enzyme maturation permease subunit